MMKTPTNAPCQLESTPAISRLLRITSISAAPMNAPIGAALAAHQVGAADHGRGDDAQLVARPSALMAEPCQPTIRIEATAAVSAETM